MDFRRDFHGAGFARDRREAAPSAVCVIPAQAGNRQETIASEEFPANASRRLPGEGNAGGEEAMSTAARTRSSRASGSLVTVEQALEFLLARARALQEVEEIELAGGRGRVLARSQVARIDVPRYANSSMDGYAVRSADVETPGRHRLPVVQRVAAGQIPLDLECGEAARIFTGAPLPEGADAVVIQENCARDGDMVCFDGPIASGDNTRPRANDIEAGTEVLAAGVRLRPQELGLAASVGLAKLPVYRRLRVAIFSSGDELVAPGEPLGPGAIFNSNRYTLLGLLDALDCESIDVGMVADSLKATRDTLRQAAEGADLVIGSGGMSVGEEDHVRTALEQTGRLEMWKVAVKPGKPLAYGRIGDADFVGLPGNPVSTLVGFCLFVRPFILKRQGVNEVLPRPMRVRAAFSWERPGDRREFVRARLRREADGGYRVEVFPKQGSDVLTSAVWADGLVDIPEGALVRPGDPVSYYSFTELQA